MLAQFMLTAGVLILIAVGYMAVKVVKNARRLRRNRLGFTTISCNGDCGSAFEFILQLENGRISQAVTNGGRCAHSFICAQAAADLAKGRTISEINEITPNDIAKKAGGLTPEHRHCAILAAHGLAQAVKALAAGEADGANA